MLLAGSASDPLASSQLSASSVSSVVPFIIRVQMKLGIVGMLPGDFRTHEPSHFEAIRELGFTGAGFHLPGDIAPEITPADIDRELGFLSDYEIELVQMGVGYGECLFDPDPEVRQEGSRKIINSVKVAAALSARYCLIRPGSLNPEGSWTAHRDNHTDSAWDLFIETLRGIVPALDECGVTIVMETHVGNFCMVGGGPASFELAPPLLIAGQCEQIGFASTDAYEMGLQQSVAFANFVSTVDAESGGTIQVSIFSRGNTEPLVPYPTTTPGISADFWNEIAAQNNRVEVSIDPF